MIEQRAWVESDEAPEEMRKVVFEVKGTKCTAYGCSRGASTLVHRVPPKDGGRTSVENLFPVCDEHAHDPDSRDVGWSFWPRVSRVHIR